MSTQVQLLYSLLLFVIKFFFRPHILFCVIKKLFQGENQKGCSINKRSVYIAASRVLRFNHMSKADYLGRCRCWKRAEERRVNPEN